MSEPIERIVMKAFVAYLLILGVAGCAKKENCSFCHDQLGIVYGARMRRDCHGKLDVSCWLCEACPRCNKCAAKITEVDVAPEGNVPKGFEDCDRRWCRVTKNAKLDNHE